MPIILMNVVNTFFSFHGMGHSCRSSKKYQDKIKREEDDEPNAEKPKKSKKEKKEKKEKKSAK